MVKSLLSGLLPYFDSLCLYHGIRAGLFRSRPCWHSILLALYTKVCSKTGQKQFSCNGCAYRPIQKYQPIEPDLGRASSSLSSLLCSCLVVSSRLLCFSEEKRHTRAGNTAYTSVAEDPVLGCHGRIFT